jgi:hypothetical protein
VTWLLWLYPPAWRRRYGGELADLIATQPASFGTAIDLVAAAIDAWINPQSSTAAAAGDAKGAGSDGFPKRPGRVQAVFIVGSQRTLIGSLSAPASVLAERPGASGGSHS